jgi:hypothetical protein
MLRPSRSLSHGMKLFISTCMLYYRLLSEHLCVRIQHIPPLRVSIGPRPLLVYPLMSNFVPKFPMSPYAWISQSRFPTYLRTVDKGSASLRLVIWSLVRATSWSLLSGFCQAVAPSSITALGRDRNVQFLLPFVPTPITLSIHRSIRTVPASLPPSSLTLEVGIICALESIQQNSADYCLPSAMILTLPCIRGYLRLRCNSLQLAYSVVSRLHYLIYLAQFSAAQHTLTSRFL